jgi:hypothetical protein
MIKWKEFKREANFYKIRVDVYQRIINATIIIGSKGQFNHLYDDFIAYAILTIGRATFKSYNQIKVPDSTVSLSELFPVLNNRLEKLESNE